MLDLNLLQRNIPLAPWTTLKIGGPAKYFVEAKTAEQLIEAVAWAKSHGEPMRILGAGSNTLVSDHGFAGLVIVTRNDQMDWQPPRVIVGAGARLGQFIAAAAQHGLGGLIWLIGVPGSVGGSLYGNAGSRTEAIGDYVDWVEVVTADGQLQRWTKEQCGFRYRHSQFKEQPITIIQAQLQLPLVDPTAERQALAAKAKEKNTNQPTTASSAGCMFKNTTVADINVPAELQPFVLPDRTISSWRLIDAVGLRGRQLGQMQISAKHANFLVNLGSGSADQAVQLISLVKQRVRDTLGIQLHEEIQYLGF